MKQVWNELRKVVWPTRKQAMIFTGVVLLSVVAMAIMIWIVDTLLQQLFMLVL